MRPLTALALRRSSVSCLWRFEPRVPVGIRTCHSQAVEKNIIKSKYKDLPLSRLPYFDFVWSNREKHAHRTALVDGISGSSLNYLESYRLSRNFGSALKSMGANKGDVLGLLLPNCIEYPIVFSGASKIGVTLTTMNPVYTPREIARQLKMSNASWAVTNSDLLSIVKAAVDILETEGVCKKGGWRDRIIVTGEPIEGYLSVNDMMTREATEKSSVPIDVDKDILALPYSSGTTGLPKGVMLSHFNIVGNACQETLSHEEMRIAPPAEGDYQPVTLCVLPLFHIYALNVTMTPVLYQGGKLVCLPRFEPKTFVKALETYRPTFLHLAPPLLSFCVNSPDVTPKHMESLEYVMTAAAPTGPTLIQKFKKKTPQIILREGWGMSETSPFVLVSPLTKSVEGSCGINVPNTDTKIVDISSGEPLGPNQRGELCVRGPQVMLGYLNNEKATAETIKDGWLHSGDIAYYDEDNFIFIVDRLKELIKVKGFQVPPAELEDLLRTLGDVADVAVVGIPHERFGEAPRAFVVPKSGSKLTTDDVTKYVEVNAAPYKHLIGGVEFVNVIPKSASGKILRRELKDKYVSEQKAN